jgi:L-2-hydroxyglutarate oxidase
MIFDIAIVGAGIVGMATAYQLLEKSPGLKILVLDKETSVARHQSSRNSGVIHSGIYYTPGSLKAKKCFEGYHQLIKFAIEQEVPFDICGKIIVATNEAERPILDSILQKGKANGLKGLELIGREEAREIEPHVNCVAAIKVPQAGIINYGAVTQKYLEIFTQNGGQFVGGAKVHQINEGPDGLLIETEKGDFFSWMVINCAGLYSDKITELTTDQIDLKILPFRGEYFELKKEKEYLVRNLIYPVPNRNFPFLGVHFTRMIDGGIEAGPNAVLAFKREGYHRWDINMSELIETLNYPGFQKLAAKYWRDGWMEMRRSFSKKFFVKALQKLIPEITEDDVVHGRSGVRAMACQPDGNLVDDFKIIESEHIINVCNAPSPAATSSLAIGETVANIALKKLS